MRRKPLAVGLAITVAMVIGTSLAAGGGAALAAGPPTSVPGTVGLWAADWGTAASTRTSAGWESAAKHDSLLIGQPGVYKPWMSQLRAWNPNLTILAYNLGPYLQKGSANFTTIMAQDPSWFAHDSHGNLITLRLFPDNYLMEMSNPAYRAWHAEQLAATVSQYGFDGAMDDSMGTAPLTGTYASAVAVDPATGKAYTPTEYLDNAVLMLNADKAALGTKYLAFNGLINGQTFEEDTNILATSNANAGVSELFLRGPDSPVTTFPTSTDVQDSLDMMATMAADGKTFLGWTKVWSSSTKAQLAKWEQFDLGVYLLGQQSGSFLDFMPSETADNTVVAYTNLEDQLGAPKGAAQLSGSTYTRSFKLGSVTVNLSSDTATIDVTTSGSLVAAAAAALAAGARA